MTTKRLKRPRDPIQLGKLIVESQRGESTIASMMAEIRQPRNLAGAAEERGPRI